MEGLDTATLIPASGAGLAVTLLALGALLATRGGEATMQRRIETLRASSPYLPDALAERPTSSRMLRDRREFRIPLVDRWLRGRAITEGTRLQLQRAGLRLKVGEFLVLRGIAAVAGAGFTAAAAGPLGLEGVLPLLLGVGALVGFAFPALLLRMRVNRRKRLIEQQLVEFSEIVAAMLEAGFGYMQTLASAAEQLDDPLSQEVQRLVDTVRIGGDVDEALAAMAERLDSRDFDMVASAIAIHRTAGGDLSEILRGVGATVRDRQSFAREVRALTSRERYSAIIVAGFPVLIWAALSLMAPDVFGRLVTDPIGNVILAVAVGLDTAGYLAIRKIAKIEV